MPARKRPNLLLVMSDQHRGDCLSIDGHPAVLTPNLDSLGHAGTHFRRAYSTCPSCIPARRALLTGQFPATNGVPGFWGDVPIPDDTPTLPQLLRDGGYQTALIGRHMHQSPYSRRYGYELCRYANTYQPDEYSRELEASTPGASIREVGLSFNGYTARPWPFAEPLHPTNWIMRHGREYLEGDRDESCPLFLTLSFYAPHPPLLPPDFYFDRYLRLDLPDRALGDWTEAPPPTNIDAARVDLRGEALRCAQAGYYGLINHLDDQLFWFLQHFRQVSQAEGRDWLIVYTSDHGEMLGDHHYFRKCEPYEGSARIPLLIAGSPGLELQHAQVNESPVALEDLLPTFLAAANLDCPDAVDGQNLLPVLRGDATSVRDVLHGEHAPCYSREQAHQYLVDGRYKYIWRPFDDEQQLFDLTVDPRETRDLAGLPGHEAAVKEWRARLFAQLVDRPEGFCGATDLQAVSDWVNPHRNP